MAGFLYFRGKHHRKQPVITLAAAVPGRIIDGFPGADFNTVQPFKRVHRNLLCRIYGFDKCVDLLRGAEFPPGQMGLFFAYGSFPTLCQAPFLDKFVEAQAFEDAIQGAGIVLIPEIVLRLKVQGHVPDDGSQPIGHFRTFPALGQLLADAFLNFQAVQIFINVFDLPIALHQVHGGLFAHAGDAGDVIRAIPHECLQIHHQGRREAVFLLKALRRIQHRFGLAHAGFHVADAGGIGNQLQAILIAGNDDAVPAAFLAYGGGGAQNIVSFKTLQLVAADAHGVQNFFQDGHLGRQLLWHTLALGLVGLILLMAEGGSFQVKTDADRLRLLLLQQTLQDGHKAVNSVGWGAVRGVQGTDAVKGPVDDAVAVQDH